MPINWIWIMMIRRTRERNLQSLLNELNSKFYHRKHPKSLGFRFVKETIMPIMNSYSLPIVDF
jgi:hypothetical protein